MGRPKTCSPCCEIMCPECSEPMPDTLFATLVDGGGLFPCACAHGEVITLTYTPHVTLWSGAAGWEGSKIIAGTLFEFGMVCSTTFQMRQRVASTGSCRQDGNNLLTTRISLVCSPFAASYNSPLFTGVGCGQFRIDVTE